MSVNDCFRPVSRFFDRITRPEQLLTALPEAMRVLTSPSEAGAVVIALPQDIQTEAHDYPVAFFEPREWTIARPAPHPDDVAAVARLIADAEQPVIIAGGGVQYSEAEAELAALAEQLGIPVLETFAGKGAVQQDVWWGMGGVGLEGNPAANALAAEADLVLHVGTRLTDFTTGLAVAVRQPARAVRVGQRGGPGRPQAGRDARGRRRQARPHGAAGGDPRDAAARGVGRAGARRQAATGCRCARRRSPARARRR